MKQSILTWMPAAFCLILAVFTSSAATESVRQQSISLCFLATCFALLGSNLSGTRREVRELRKRLAELEAKRVG
jgi:O-antigen ligase